MYQDLGDLSRHFTTRLHQEEGEARSRRVLGELPASGPRVRSTSGAVELGPATLERAMMSALFVAGGSQAQPRE